MRIKKYVAPVVLCVAASVGIMVAPAAHAAQTHYVAFVAGAVTHKSARLTNTYHGGGIICYDLQSLTAEGAPYTTTYVVYDGYPVDVDFDSSNNCRDETMERSGWFTLQSRYDT